jgi:DNA sulfur modification protein DndD
MRLKKMRIKSIQLGNFGCYKGINKPIIFSIDASKNVTVILGANKSGKTTLVHAFIWCLYGNEYNKNDLDLINIEVKKEISHVSSLEMFVEIVLIHADREYIIRRELPFLKSSGQIRSLKSNLKIYYKESSGEQQSIFHLDCQDTVNNILPKELSDYFFYEGERFVDINKKDVASAVKGLMGLDAISVARERFDPKSAKSVTSKLRSGLKLVQDDAQKNESLQDKLSKSQDKLDTVIARLQEAKKEQQFFSNRKDELGIKLSKNASAKQMQTDRKQLENDVSGFRDGALSFFAQPLIDQALSAIENSNQNGEGIPEMRQAAIDHILGRNRCICGCDLQENEGARRRILSERNLLPPEHLGTILRNHKRALLGYRSSSSDFVERIENSYTNWRDNVRFLDRKNEELKKKCEEIASTGSIDLNKIESAYQETIQKLDHINILRDRLLEEKGATERGIEDCTKKIASLVGQNEYNFKIQRIMAYADALFKMFDEIYSRREQEVKANLNESVNRIFSNMYHGRRLVEIDDKYQIRLLTTIGSSQEEIADTGGLRAVKNFAYITGLVDIARKHVAQVIETDAHNEDISSSTEPYPLVMDAPFSATDEKHIENISRIIPDIAEQVIIIVMQKDWAYAKTTLEAKVGKRYVIENINNSETHSTIRES